MKDGTVPPPPVQRWRAPLRPLVLAASGLAGLALCLSVSSILILNARTAVEQETAAAFRAAAQTVRMRMPQAFAAGDTLDLAWRLADEIDAQRHVAARIADQQGVALQQRAGTPQAADHEVPGWFADLLWPHVEVERFPVTRYPNILGMLELATDPVDEIAEVWEDFRIVLPVIALTALTMVLLTFGLTTLITRRIRRVQRALTAMRAGDLSSRAPDDIWAEMAGLSEGVNDLASHLQAERAENDLLQTRLLTLSEAERAKIASDLHDEMGPQLFALNAAVSQARALATGLPPAQAAQMQEVLVATLIHARAVRNSARAAINDLRPMLLGHGSLSELMAELVADFAEISPDVAIRLEVDCDAVVDELAELSIYRFARESVLNAIRHGGADCIDLMLHLDDRAQPPVIVARVRDNGSGPAGGPVARSFGVTGIHDRARALHATYQPPVRRGAATETELRMPC